MKDRYIYTSLTRISDLEKKSFTHQRLAKSNWASADYVLAQVENHNHSSHRAELANGRMMDLLNGDILVGALGVRYASLEATGTWKSVGRDQSMDLLTGAGLLGKLTSKSLFIHGLVQVQYLGHVMINGEKVNMTDFAPTAEKSKLEIPVIVIFGTSMSSGKTMSARIIIRQLKRLGLKVVGAKLSGAGRYRDILAMHDAGADYVYDFVDVGLPSTVVTPSAYKVALRRMLSLISASEAEVAVIEIGASPLEPYNGDLAMAAIADQVVCRVLCASDPYAVYGIMQSFQVRPTLVSGPAVNTLGGIELVEKLCQVKALNLINIENLPKLRKLLQEKLNLPSKVSVPSSR